jgi:hypothetical protein
VHGGLTIQQPLDGALYPPDIAPPTFRWTDRTAADIWLVGVELDAPKERIEILVRESAWSPERALWERIKGGSTHAHVRLTVAGAVAAKPRALLSRGSASFRTSTDPVEAPIFYRDVPLPFVEAVKDPSTIRWRFGSIASPEQPPVVLEGLPVCGNCHSFSADGRTLGMDVDFGNDKGSYALVDVASEMVIGREQMMTWSDFEGSGAPTFGLLSQVSPDGRRVISTVEDRSVFVVTEELAYSQLFFPVRGILAVYDRQDGSLRPLPGADDPAFVQSNPTWSPDGRTVVFARAPAVELGPLRNPEIALLTPDEARDFTDGDRILRYDLYRVPFDEGRGGRPGPIRGASGNDRSNYFARYSPDGRWIVFCQADRFMLLQPDAELFIVPAEGGEARRLDANLPGMNSWHSWSPNGRWLLFSSKGETPYTRLYLTHIDDDGHSSPPVSLDWFVAPDRAANIPEFVNAPDGAIRSIEERFVDGISYARTAHANLVVGDPDGAIRALERALELEPDDPRMHSNLGSLLFVRGELTRAEHHLSEAVRLAPGSVEARVNLAGPLAALGRLDEAEAALRTAVRLAPDDPLAWRNLGLVLEAGGRAEEAVAAFGRALILDPGDPEAGRGLARVRARGE